ncbi:MAG: uracil-DNA glycosylase [Rhodovulum sp.]|nr:uracil-DNA glycosylase [Rhodovulum sp.]
MSGDRTSPDAGPDAVRGLLAFYLDAGVDALLVETPQDRLRPDDLTAHSPAPEAVTTAVAAPPTSTPRHSAPARAAAPAAREPVGAAPATPDDAVMAARTAARGAATLEELAAILAGFEGCPLKATATRLCFADGRPGAPVMFVGEAPGRDEDLEGLPFVGRSGKLLDRMMAAIGLARSDTYIANVVPWRPPGNRTPTPLETQICLPFIQRQIELADPDVLVCLGAPAAQTLIGTREGIMKTRGRWFTYHTGRREIRAIATLHPAYLLRQPLAKRLAWRDFLAIKAALEAARPGAPT